MPVDNSLNFTTRVDLSGLNDGVSAASTKIAGFATTTKSAMQAATDAANRLASAQLQIGKSAAEGNAAAIAILQEYKEELDQANATLAEMQAATKGAAAATVELGEAEAAEEVIQRRSISTRMIASAALGELRGSAMGGQRAISALAASLPGMAAALEVAFPVIAAIALVEVLGQMAEKVHKVYDEYVNLRSFQNATLKEMTEADKEEVRLSEEKLRIRREQRVVDAELGAPKKGRSDVGAAAGASFDITQDQVRAQTALDNIKAANQERARLEAQSKETVTKTGLIGPYQEQTLAARQATQEINKLDQELRTYVTDYDVASAKIQADRDKERLRVKEAGEKQEGNPDQLLLKKIEDEFAVKREQAVSQRGEMTPGENASYWAQYLTTFRDGTDQARAILEKYSTAVAENHRKIVESFKKLTAEQERAEQEGSSAIERGMAANNKAVAETIDDILRVGPQWDAYSRSVAENSIIVAENARNAEVARIKLEEAEGVITRLAADQRIAALDTANLTEKIKELQIELSKLQQEGAGLKPGQSGYEKNIEQQQQVMNQILKAQGQQTVQAITDNGKITQDIVQPFTRAFQQINSQFQQAIGSIRNGTESVSQAFSKMGINILESVEDAFLKMILESAEAEIKMTLAHVFGNETRVASDQTAAAQTVAISKETALSEIFDDAKTAAAGAYKALVGIPVVGPVLAPVAAGATFAAVLALGAFEQGGVIPGSGAVPILGHGGERVLTNRETSTFESFVHNMTQVPQTAAGNIAHLHFEPTINAFNGHGLRQAIRESSGDILDIVREGLNTGALGRGKI